MSLEQHWKLLHWEALLACGGSCTSRLLWVAGVRAESGEERGTVLAVLGGYGGWQVFRPRDHPI